MKVSLNLLERVMLFQLITTHPRFQQGSASTWRHIEAAKQVLALTDKENTDYGIEITPDPATGNAQLFARNKELSEQRHDYQLPDPLFASLVTFLSEMNEKKELKADSYKLFEAIVGDKA